MTIKSEISSVLGSSGVALEAGAAKAFGAAVENFASGSFADMLGVKTGVGAANENTNFYATSYATGFNTSMRPALKFLFTVEFVFKNQDISMLSAFKKFDPNQNFEYMVRSIDRPSFTFEYQDINEYNFRSKVLKKVTKGPINMKLHEDVGRKVYAFMRTILAAHLPTMRSNPAAIATSTATNAEMQPYSGRTGMNFGDNYFVSSGSLVPTDLGNVFQLIRIKQYSVRPDVPMQSAVNETVYDFFNPMITNLNFGNLSHDESAPCEVDLSFEYDILRSSTRTINESPVSKKIKSGTGAPADITVAPKSDASESEGMDFFHKLTSSAAKRATQKVTSKVLNNVLKNIPGGKQAANALSSVIGSAVGNVAVKGLDAAVYEVGKRLITADSGKVGGKDGTSS